MSAASAAAAAASGANPYFDESKAWELKTARQTKALNFHEPGFHQEIAKKERARAKLEKLQQEIASAAKHTSRIFGCSCELASPLAPQFLFFNNSLLFFAALPRYFVGSQAGADGVAQG